MSTFLSNPTFEKLVGKVPIVGNSAFHLGKLSLRCLALSLASYLAVANSLFAVFERCCTVVLKATSFTSRAECLTYTCMVDSLVKINNIKPLQRTFRDAYLLRSIAWNCAPLL